MRHPLTGGGMTVALSDTKLLCDMLQPLPDFTDSVQTAKCTSDFYIKRKPLSSTINTLAEALYEVFRQKEAEAHEEMRQAVFDYLALGACIRPLRIVHCECVTATLSVDSCTLHRVAAVVAHLLHSTAPAVLGAEAGKAACDHSNDRQCRCIEPVTLSTLCLRAGKRFAAGPVSLLSGLNPDPSALVAYLLAIAVFASCRLPLRKGLRGVWLAFAVLVVACKIILPIIQAEGIRCAGPRCRLLLLIANYAMRVQKLLPQVWPLMRAFPVLVQRYHAGGTLHW